MQNPFNWELFERRPLVGILRGFTCEAAVNGASAAAEGGLTTIEVTLNTVGAVEQIRQLRAALGDSANVGAGTVCSVEDVDVAIGGGATFIVTPVVDAEVIQACRAADLPVFVGAMTPTEMFQAWRLGATMVKVFPADILGPAYLSSLRGPLPQIPLMPTGGVTVENLSEYHCAGAVAFGIGGPLFDKKRIAAGDWDWVRLQAERFVIAFEASKAAVGDNAGAFRKS